MTEQCSVNAGVPRIGLFGVSGGGDGRIFAPSGRRVGRRRPASTTGARGAGYTADVVVRRSERSALGTILKTSSGWKAVKNRRGRAAVTGIPPSAPPEPGPNDGTFATAGHRGKACRDRPEPEHSATTDAAISSRLGARCRPFRIPGALRLHAGRALCSQSAWIRPCRVIAPLLSP